MTGPLCDAVTQERGSSAVLESLERRNLLTFALDAHRHWFRYHQLFADVLQSRLLVERPDDAAALGGLTALLAEGRVTREPLGSDALWRPAG